MDPCYANSAQQEQCKSSNLGSANLFRLFLARFAPDPSTRGAVSVYPSHRRHPWTGARVRDGHGDEKCIDPEAAVPLFGMHRKDDGKARPEPIALDPFQRDAVYVLPASRLVACRREQTLTPVWAGSQSPTVIRSMILARYAHCADFGTIPESFRLSGCRSQDPPNGLSAVAAEPSVKSKLARAAPASPITGNPACRFRHRRAGRSGHDLFELVQEKPRRPL